MGRTVGFGRGAGVGRSRSTGERGPVTDWRRLIVRRGPVHVAGMRWDGEGTACGGRTTNGAGARCGTHGGNRHAVRNDEEAPQCRVGSDDALVVPQIGGPWAVAVSPCKIWVRGVQCVACCQGQGLLLAGCAANRASPWSDGAPGPTRRHLT